MSDPLESGRQAYAATAWAVACDHLAAADARQPLGVDDLERLATAAYLSGQDAQCDAALARAHAEFRRLGQPARAARAAFWLAFDLLGRGEVARSAGWLGRARRLVDAAGECAEQGYLLVPQGLEHLAAGDPAAALADFEFAAAIAERCGDPDLAALGCLGRGQSLIALDRGTDALALLDEAIVAVTSGEVSARVVGLVYCAAIEACQDLFDLGRAQEWTTALSRWCDSQPQLVPYRGQCLVHRAEILQLHGSWVDAIDEAGRACSRLAGGPAVGAAHYRQAELFRLRGQLAAAEEAYRLASRWGREPQPGLSLLRLAQGRSDAAHAAISRVLGETVGDLARSRVLPAYVEIALAVGDIDAARRGAVELDEIAEHIQAPVLRALAAQATGAVRLAVGDPGGALPLLRAAAEAWADLRAPYETARVRVLVGRACRALGDADGAELELDTARLSFQRLGAATDLARMSSAPRARAHVSGLTDRELEVLTLVATGKTNREISAELVISEHTVARHLQNIYGKLGVPTRTAAAAFAHQHHIS